MMTIQELINELQKLADNGETDIVLDFEDRTGSTTDYHKLSDYSIADIDYENFDNAEDLLSIRLQEF